VALTLTLTRRTRPFRPVPSQLWRLGRPGRTRRGAPPPVQGRVADRRRLRLRRRQQGSARAHRQSATKAPKHPSAVAPKLAAAHAATQRSGSPRRLDAEESLPQCLRLLRR
jgi:hypothetical protein